MHPERASLLGLPVSLSPRVVDTLSVMEKILTNPSPGLITFINPHAFYLSSMNQGYLNSLWHFDLVLPDGIGVVKALSWLNNKDVARQSFDATSLYGPVLSLLNRGGFSLCLVGAKPTIANAAQEKMAAIYPDVRYLGCLDGYRSFDETIDWVMERKPDVVLVGMGAPYQEAFLIRLKQSGFTGLGITCGGFLDQMVKQDRYYPHIVDKLNLRWLYRLLKEPQRLARRYLIEYRGFILNVLYRHVAKKLFDQHDIPVVWR